VAGLWGADDHVFELELLHLGCNREGLAALLRWLLTQVYEYVGDF